MLSKEGIFEFKEIFDKRYKTNISLEQATEMANRVFNFYKIIIKPIPKDKELILKGGEK